MDGFEHWKVVSYQFRYGVQDEVGGYTIYCNVFSYHHGQLIIKSNNLVVFASYLYGEWRFIVVERFSVVNSKIKINTKTKLLTG